ncbi:MAG: peptidylprolyl isomerase [candidate division WOR-3 bacterium]
MKRIFFVILTIFIIFSFYGCKKNEKKEEKMETKTIDPLKNFDFKKDYLALFVWQSKDGKEEDTMVIRFYPEKAPNHVKNFLTLSLKKFYNGLIIFRVEPKFVIQTGSPDNTNMGGPGYTIDAEFNDIKHIKGTVAMARAQDPNSAGSQFYICLDSTPHLDGKYTVFGQVIEKIEVLDKISKGDYMKEIKIVKAKDYYGENYKKLIKQKDPHEEY